MATDADIMRVEGLTMAHGERVIQQGLDFAVRRGEVVDPQVYGDDVIVVETSGSRTAVREFIDKLGVFAMFLAL